MRWLVSGCSGAVSAYFNGQQKIPGCRRYKNVYQNAGNHAGEQILFKDAVPQNGEVVPVEGGRAGVLFHPIALSAIQNIACCCFTDNSGIFLQYAAESDYFSFAVPNVWQEYMLEKKDSRLPMLMNRQESEQAMQPIDEYAEVRCKPSMQRCWYFGFRKPTR